MGGACERIHAIFVLDIHFSGVLWVSGTLLFIFELFILLASILFSTYCPQGPQWSSLDKSTRLFTFVLHCSILHLPTGLDTSFGVNFFI